MLVTQFLATVSDDGVTLYSVTDGSGTIERTEAGVQIIPCPMIRDYMSLLGTVLRVLMM